MKLNLRKNIDIILGILIIAGASYGAYRYNLTYKELLFTKANLSSTTAELMIAKSENNSLSEILTAEQQKNSTFEGQIKEITGTLGVLDKLAKTDKELLEKYSKVYFLNEHYVPSSLATITPEYLYEKNRIQKIHGKVFPYLETMIKDAAEAGIDLKIISAYRSFGEQSALKGSYTVTYGTGANKFSADQGYSEHQLGTALDLTTPKSGANFNGFKSTSAYDWLTQNAYKYGFVLSYPENNTYYQFEPWHWRFVGKNLANRLHEDKVYFYDLDQRIINLYLVSLFD